MGTRHLICAMIDGQYKLAQYGQWDGYPEGQGVDVLAFLKGDRVELFKSNLRTLTEASEEKIEELWIECGARRGADMVPMSAGARMAERYPQFSRDTGSDILDWVSKNPHGLISTNIDFACDSLFCEWCYVIDFDKGTFEVYGGFNKNPIDATERFATMWLSRRDTPHNSGYGPVRLLRSWPLSALPTEDDFLRGLGVEPKSYAGDDSGDERMMVVAIVSGLGDAAAGFKKGNGSGDGS